MDIIWFADSFPTWDSEMFLTIFKVDETRKNTIAAQRDSNPHLVVFVADVLII